jgi:hypothetical protein
MNPPPTGARSAAAVVEPGGAAPLEIRPYRAGDEGAILDAFRNTFGRGAKDVEGRTLAVWEWAYRSNPAGMRAWVAMDGGLVAAHYASRPVRVRVEGREGTFAQIVDCFVRAEHRAGRKGPRLFAETGRRLLESTCGPGKDLVAYGWPTRAAWRLGRAFLGYGLVRRETSLSLELGRGPRGLPAGIETLDAFDGRTQRLYERCAREWPASAIRDERYLGWRVSRHPLRPYRVIAAPDGCGGLAGHAITRLSDWPVERALLVTDWLVPSDEVEAADALLEGVRELARTLGARILIAVFPEWSPWFARFQQHGFYAAPSDYHMVSGSYNDPRYGCEWLRENWWYQPLDLDLF